jgi:ketosteroid isomerase-like protein
MNQRVRFALMILGTILSALIASGQATKPAAKPAAKGVFDALIERYYAAWNTGNPDNAAPLYAKDADLVFYDLTPLQYTGWAEYDKGVRAVLGSFAAAKFTTRGDLKSTRRGSIAWTTVTYHLSGKKKTGESVEVDGRHTVIWENRSGKWLIVHEHFSVPL